MANGTTNEKKSLSYTIVIALLAMVVVAGTVYIMAPWRNERETYHAESPESIIERLEQQAGRETHERVRQYLEHSRAALGEGSSVVDVARKAGPSVVGIRMSIADGGQILGIPLGELKAEGSGVIISEDGF